MWIYVCQDDLCLVSGIELSNHIPEPVPCMVPIHLHRQAREGWDWYRYRHAYPITNHLCAALILISGNG